MKHLARCFWERRVYATCQWPDTCSTHVGTSGQLLLIRAHAICWWWSRSLFMMYLYLCDQNPVTILVELFGEKRRQSRQTIETKKIAVLYCIKSRCVGTLARIILLFQSLYCTVEDDFSFVIYRSRRALYEEILLFIDCGFYIIRICNTYKTPRNNISLFNKASFGTFCRGRLRGHVTPWPHKI